MHLVNAFNNIIYTLPKNSRIVCITYVNYIFIKLQCNKNVLNYALNVNINLKIAKIYTTYNKSNFSNISINIFYGN